MSTKIMGSRSGAAVKAVTVDEQLFTYESVKLSDNLPSVKEILFTNARAVISGVKTAANVHSVKGETSVSVLYLGDNERIESVSAIIPFEFVTDAFSEKDRLLAEVSVLSAETSKVKQRRLDITVNVKLSGLCIQNKESDYIENIEGDGVFVKKAQRTAASVYKMSAVTPVELDIQGILSDEAKNVFSSVTVTESATNANETGIMLSATLNVQSLVKTLLNEETAFRVLSETQTAAKTVPLPPELSYENYFANVSAVIKDTATIPTDDGFCLRLYAEVQFDLTFFGKLAWSELSDAYALDVKLVPETAMCENCVLKNSVIKQLDLSADHALSQRAAFYRPVINNINTNHSFFVNDKAVNVSGELNVNVFVLENAEGAYEAFELTLPFNCSIEENLTENSEIFISINALASEISCETGVLHFEGCVTVNALIFENESYESIEEINEESYPVTEKDYTEITVVYLSDSENLWEIAKLNRTDIKTVLSDNMLDSADNIPMGTPLLVKH